MVMYQQEISNLVAAQQQAQSQTALRQQQGIQGLQQRQQQVAQLQQKEQQLKQLQQQEQQSIQQQLQQQQSQQAQEQRATEAIRVVEELAKDYGRTGSIVYNSQVGDALRELVAATGISMSEAKKFYEGTTESVPQYQRGSYEAGIREQQTTIGKSLVSGEKPVYSKSGTLTGVESLYFGKTLTPEQYNIQVAQLQKVPTPAEVLNDKPLGVYSKAPTGLQKFQQQVFPEGKQSFSAKNLFGIAPLVSVPTRLFKYGVGMLEKSEDITQQKTRQFERSQEMLSFWRTYPEFVTYAAAPATAISTLMFSSGVESLGTTTGRSQIKQQETALKEGGLNPIVATGISYGVPALNLFLGGVGVKQSIKQAYYKTLTPKTEFLAVENFGDKSSTVNVISRTKIGKLQATSVSRGLIVDVGQTGTFRAGVGKGFTTLGGKQQPLLSPKTSLLQEAFIAKVVPTARLTRNNAGVKVSQEFESGVLSTGGVKLTEGKLEGFFKSNVAGGFKQIKEDIVGFVGGDILKKRIYATGKQSIVTQPTIKGIIKTVKPQPKVQVFDIGGQDLLTKTKTVQRTVIGQVGVQRQAEIAMIRAELKPTQAPRVFFSGTIGVTQLQQPKTLTTQKTGQETKQEQRQIPTQVQVPRLSTATTQAPVQLSRTSVVQEQIPLTRQAEQPAQRLEQQTRQQQRTQQVQSPVSVLKPKLKIPIIFPQPKPSPKQEKVFKSSTELFNVFVRRKGNWLEIGKKLPKGKAEFLGTKYSMTTLGRSFKLEKAGAGDVADISFKVPSNIFRPAKREAGVYVQRARYSLSSGTEKSEIQMFRKKKKRNKNLNWF